MMPDRQYIFVTAVTSDQIRQIITLYREKGWWEVDDGDDPRLVSRLISGSHCFLAVFEGEQIVGMARAISDRVSDAYIQDVKVLLSRRGQGIGKMMIETIVERLHTDGLRWIGLIAERDSDRFYENLGFKTMPSSKPMLLKG
jgi:aralkylamine N-acetyltransferase